jgi:phage FluMu protein Com
MVQSENIRSAGMNRAVLCKDVYGIKWAHCWQCNHKLLRVVSAGQTNLEIKCSSCKSMNALKFEARKEISQ